MQTKVSELELELESERAKKRQIDREISEMQIHQNTQQETSRTQWLKEEIVKKNAQIASANRELRSMMETREAAPRSADNLQRLESELMEIKHMLADVGQRNKIPNILEQFSDENSQPFDNSQDQIKYQKQQIKEMQEKIEQAKAQYKLDRTAVEDLRLKDPALYRKK